MIAISAGHWAQARGARNQSGFYEYPETMRWARTIFDIYREEYGHAVLVPAEDLASKVNFINTAVSLSRIQLAVEIHFNSSPGGQGRGSETLYYPGSVAGAKAAKIVQDKLALIMPPSRGIKEGWYKMDRPGIQDYPGDKDGDETPDYFLSATDCAAIVVEPEFIQNPAAIMGNRQICCEAIAAAMHEAVQVI